MDPLVARKTWRTLEPFHGLVYFAPEPAARYAALGIDGFDGYFASRAAPMGAVGAEVVQALFFNFHPSVVAHAVPAAWQVATPQQVLDARHAGTLESLERVTGDALDGDELVRAAELVRVAVDASGASMGGRALAAAHHGLPWPDDPRLALWHGISVLREHRGDGHVVCLTEAGFDACEALVVHAASGEVPRVALQGTRHWSDDEWDAAVERLAGRGLVTDDGAFTDAGRALRQRIEDRTDELAVPPWAALGEDGCEQLRALVRPASRAIVEGGSFGLR